MKLILGFLLLISSSVFAGLKVVPGTIQGFDGYPAQLDRIHQAFQVIEVVINSESFKKKVIYNDGRNYTANQGLTNTQIYQRLMTGRELENGQNTLGEINFNLKRHYWYWPYKKKVVAQIDNSAVNSVLLSAYFYSFYEVHNIAGNLTHEWTHLVGFSHASAKDTESVPYVIGEIMSELAEQYLNNGFIE